MIATAPLVDTLAAIDFADATYDDVALALQNAEYAEGDAAGFTTETFREDEISGHLVVSSPTTVGAYDAASGAVSEQEVDQTDVVPFRIDFADDLLEVFGGRADARRVRDHLGRLDDASLTFEDFEIDVPGLYDALAAGDLDTTVTSVRVRNFSPIEQTEGDCFLRVGEDADVDALLDEYGSDVYFLGTELAVDGDTVTVGVYETGAVQVYSSTDATESLLASLKTAVR
ncbi:MAG: hypothetical protein ABEH83_05235 [Halobacterium sp.]